MSKPGFRTPLGRVRGLGSAKEGVQHWWLQRVTAVALVPLVVLFVAYLVTLTGQDYGDVRAALGRPVPALIALLLVVALFWHLKLGLQVVIEDYVHAEGVKIVSLLAMNFACIVVGLACVLAVLSIAVGG
jgi:succinate dehydrogenase / fumarate reductase membrane anchor subunit